MTEVLLDCFVALLIAMTEWDMGNGGVVKGGEWEKVLRVENCLQKVGNCGMICGKSGLLRRLKNSFVTTEERKVGL